MPRFHNVNGEHIQFTAEEESARNAEEASWESAKPAHYLTRLRAKRNALLVTSDWTQYTDSPLTDEVKAEWTVYREELRDLPVTTDDPADPTWPEAPE